MPKAWSLIVAGLVLAALAAFTLLKGARAVLENPMGTPLIPSWRRVSAGIPGVLDLLRDAVDDDNG